MEFAKAKVLIYRFVWSYNACGPKQDRSRARHYVQIAAMIVRDLMDGMLSLRALGLVYTTLLSIVPLLAISLSILKWLGVHDRLEPILLRIFAPLGESSVELSSIVVGFVDNVKIGLLGGLGLGLLVFTVMTLIYKVESALNHTWRIEDSGNLIKRFSKYLSVLLVVPVLMFSSTAITALLNSHTLFSLLDDLPYFSDIIRTGGKFIPYLLIVGAFTFIYFLVPNTRVKLRSAFFGALVAGILWKVSGVFFGWFIGHSTNYTAIYSGFAIFFMLMIGLYLIWLIILIGSSIAYYHQFPERLKWRIGDFDLSVRMREQLTFQLMVNIARCHDQQSSEPTTIDKLARYQHAPVEIIRHMIDILKADGLISLSEDSTRSYILARSPGQIRILDILRSVRKAEGNQQREKLYCDPAVASLIRSIENEYETRLGEQTLADFTHDNPEHNNL